MWTRTSTISSFPRKQKPLPTSMTKMFSICQNISLLARFDSNIKGSSSGIFDRIKAGFGQHRQIRFSSVSSHKFDQSRLRLPEDFFIKKICWPQDRLINVRQSSQLCLRHQFRLVEPQARRAEERGTKSRRGKNEYRVSCPSMRLLKSINH